MKRRVVCLLLAIVLLVGCGVGTMMHVTAANDDDRSFFTLGNAASAAFGAALYDTDGEIDASNINGSNNVGNAGGVLGFTSGEDGVIMGFIQNMTSQVQSDVSYAAVADIPGMNTSYNDTVDGHLTSVAGRSTVWYYCQYGYLLSDLGFDKTGSQGMHPIKFISGFLMMIAYVCSLIVPTVFRAIFALLRMLNPFRLFADLIEVKPDALLGLGTITQEGEGVFQAALGGLVGQVSYWYAWFQWFAEYAIIPMFFVFLILTLLLGKRTSKMPAIRKFITRMFIIFACVPVCGVLYTGALDNATSNIDEYCGQSAKIVQSTLVDFERWAQETHLHPTTRFNLSATEDGIGGGATDSTASRIRNIAYSINVNGGFEFVNPTDAVLGGLEAGLGVANQGVISRWNSSVQAKSSVSSELVADVIDLITRHMNAEFYTASDFESYAKSLMRAQNIESSAMDDVWKTSNEVSDFLKDKKFSFSDEAVTGDGTALDIWSDGHLEVANGRYFQCPDSQQFGLSTMAMYNYLNTKFDRTGATMYTIDSSSDYVRQSHYSVNLIGNGMMSFLYFVDAIVMLAAVTVVGLCYAVSMLVANVKRGLKFITSIPFALLGSLKAGARIITYVALMLIEIIGTFFIYDLVTQILLSLSSLVEAPLEAMISNAFAISPGGESSIMGVMLTGILLIDIIIVISFTTMAIRLRKALIKSFDEMAANVIDKFIDPKAGPHGNMPPPQQGGLGNGMTQGALAGAAANRGGKNGGSKDVQSTAGTSKPVTSADGTSGGMGIEGISQQDSDQDLLKPALPSGADGASAGAGGPGVSVSGTGSSGAGASAGGSLGSAGSSAAGGAAAGDAAAAGASGGMGGGAIAGKATDAMFAENNNAQADKSMGEKLLGSEDALEKHKRRSKQNEQNDRAFLAEAMGQVGAVNEERIAEESAEERKEIGKRKVKAAAQAAVGAAEVAGAAFTGDASLAQDGVKNISNGVAGMRDANDQMAEVRYNDSNKKLEAAYARENAQYMNAQTQNSAEENYDHENSNTKDVTSQDAYNKQYQTQNSGSDINVEQNQNDRMNTNSRKTLQQGRNQKQLTPDGKTSSPNRALGSGTGGTTERKGARPATQGNGQQGRSGQGQPTRSGAQGQPQRPGQQQKTTRPMDANKPSGGGMDQKQSKPMNTQPQQPSGGQQQQQRSQRMNPQPQQPQRTNSQPVQPAGPTGSGSSNGSSPIITPPPSAPSGGSSQPIEMPSDSGGGFDAPAPVNKSQPIEAPSSSGSTPSFTRNAQPSMDTPKSIDVSDVPPVNPV